LKLLLNKAASLPAVASKAFASKPFLDHASLGVSTSLVHHPFVYAELLAAKLDKFQADAWLINTGWVGGEYGSGDRCSLKYTRAIIDAIHDGTLGKLPDSEWEAMPVFGLLVPKGDVNGVPKDVLTPKLAWSKNGLDAKAFDATAGKLAALFNNNFKEYADRCTKDVLAAAPK